MRAVVIPSNRPESLQQWLDAWAPDCDWHRTYIVWDLPRCPEIRIPYGMDVIQNCWMDHEEAMGGRSWIISRKDSACRAFGFYLAFRDGAEVIGTLDDDCHPYGVRWMGRHCDALYATPCWQSTVSDIRPRGLPYRDTGTMPFVMANVGLWAGVPDLDSVSSLAGVTTNYKPPVDRTEVWARGQYRPLCGMNLAFRAEAAPLFYFPLMGQDSPYSRFDDIWAGVLAKKCCDALGWSIASGPPFVFHSRQSDAFVNLVKEAPGIAENEKFWQVIDRIEVDGTGPIHAMMSIADGLSGIPGYYTKLSRAIRDWCSLFAEISAGAQLGAA